jgi:hypothetical protein
MISHGLRRKTTLLAVFCFLCIALLYGYLCFYHRDIWSIGIYTGPDPFVVSPDPRIEEYPVLQASDVADVPATFIADPFMVHRNDMWYMFFEVMNRSSNHGDIALASSRDGRTWEYEKVVLDEPFHLSYPYVFQWNESFYMIPESHRAQAVRLYKALKFPIQWAFVTELIAADLADPSLIRWNGDWYLFALKGWDTLALFCADSLHGPWSEHPESPLVEGNGHISRPGGRIITYQGKPIRYAQDGFPTYGSAVRAFLIDSLTKTCYREHEIARSPILEASGNGWNALGMHHVDPHQLDSTTWIACVDGKRRGLVFDYRRGMAYILYRLKLLRRKLFN